MTSFEPVADGARQRDDEEQHRERHDDLGDTRDDRVDPAAEVAGDRAHQNADDHAEDRREDRDLERDPRAVEQAQELVAAELAVRARTNRVVPLAVQVGHVRERPHRQQRVRVESVRAVDVPRPVTEQRCRDRRPGVCGQQQEDDEQPADDGRLVVPEPAPDLLPVPAGATASTPSPSPAPVSTATAAPSPAPEERSSGLSATSGAKHNGVVRRLRQRLRRRSRVFG